MEGLILRTTGSWYRVLPTDGGSVVDCRLRGNYRLRGNKQTNPVACGDYVDYALQPDGTGLILDVHPRRNYIVRRATKLSKQTHVLAANIDLLLVVATPAHPRTSTGFIDRLLVTAEAYRIPAHLVVNKADLFLPSPSAPVPEPLQELLQLYASVGYPVHLVSALRGDGIDPLRTLIAGHTVLLAGHSGVGKSALLNALDPTLDLRTGAVSDWSEKGRHTTTFAELHPFAGGFLIDTPGIKEFGIVDFTPQELSHHFPELRPYLPHCHFHNCTHTHEPQCAVKAALEQGLIPEERYLSYLSILDNIASPSA